jgi:hypothetical protein
MATNFLQAMGLPFNPDDPYGSAPVPPPVIAAPPAPMAPPVIAAPPAPNMLQALQQAPAAPVAAPQASTPTRPARSRSSVLDVIGRAADVFARVGGAPALYQPTLDSRQDRELALGDHDREIDMDKLRADLARQQITAGTGAITDADTARLQRAAQGLQAIRQANPEADISAVWPVIAKQMGIPDEQAGALLQASSQNPDIFRGLAGSTNDLGKNLYFGTGPKGETVAYQIGKDGQPHILNFGAAGVTPSEPTKVVDTGDSAVVLGQSGQTKRILPKTEAPGKAADRAQAAGIAGARIRSAETIARGNQQTQLTIAGMPARSNGKAAAGGSSPVAAQNADNLLKELSGIYDKLNAGGAMVNPDHSTTGNVLSRVRSSRLGQLAEGTIGTQAQTLRDRVGSIRPQLMQTLAKATGMTGKQLDSNADVKLFMQTVTDPSASYQANQAAIAGLRRFLASNSKAAAPAASPRSSAPGRTPVKPRASAGGWSVVGVK